MSDAEVERLHGPFYVVLNADGSIHRLGGKEQDGDPCIFVNVGPHDNHTKHGRRVVRVMIELVPTDNGWRGRAYDS